MSIDFKALARDLRERAREVLPSWLPAGRFRGREFVVGSVQGEAGDSLSINWTTGMWADFAGGADAKGGDLLSLFAAINNVSMSEAARLLGGISSDPSSVPAEAVKGKPKKKIVSPAPKSAGFPPCVHYQYKEATAVYLYRDAAGAMLGAVARYDPPNIKKQVIPWTWQIDNSGKGGWRMGSWDVPRPLYGLDDLAARPEAPVLLVEGEKCADAARSLMPQYVCMTWVGGAKAYGYIDFSPLKGRRILLWPDNDHDGSGVSAMWAVGYKLLRICPQVKIIIPGADLPDKWDVADAVKQDGFNSDDGDARWQYFKAWALPLITELKEEFGNDEQKGSGDTGSDSSSAGGGREEATVGAGAESDEGGIRRGDDGAVDRKNSTDNGRAHEGYLHKEETGNDRVGDQPSPGPVVGGEAHVAGSVSATNGSKTRKVQGKRDVAVSGKKRSDGIATADDGRVDAPVVVPRLRREIYWSQWRFDVSPGNGTPLQNLSNAVATLEQDPDWKGRIWYDTFLQRIQVQTDPKVPARNWQDFDDINLQLYMQRIIGLLKISKETVASAVIQVAMSNLRNCVTGWLDTLTWDGTERIGHFFEDHFGAEGTTYCRAVSRNFWMSIVARAYMPGCKQDYMVVLEGGQGKNKSTACETIASSAWYVVQSQSIDSNEFFKVLAGKMVVEIGELEAFNSRGEMNRVKSVVSSPKDTFRGSYDRHVADHFRQCVFIGTTNRTDWNKDETGARRFWPIRTKGLVDLDAIRAGREQLFAEAVAKLKRVSIDRELQPSLVAARIEAGADWWMIPVAEAEAEQEKRFEEDSWRPYVEDFIGLRQEVRTGEILVDALKVEVGKIKRADEMRVGSVLRALGWKSVTRRESGKVVRFWVKNEEVDF